MMPAIPYTKTATTDGAWDAGVNVKRLPQKKSALRAAHAWVDPEGDADTKGSYKFPHHEVHGNGTVGAANLKACSAIIAALNGGRGGVDIPDADRRGVYTHAAAHLNAAGKDVPELKSLEELEAELRGDLMVERRMVAGAVELREDGDSKKLSGYAAVFNDETVIGGGFFGFREKILPGAFTDTIKVDDVRALFNHDPNLVLGRRAGSEKDTLRLVEDDRGLRYDIDPPNTVQARDLVELVSRGDISQSSFAFIVPKGGDDWNYDDVQNGKLPLRTIKKVQLMDVSPVTYPAYPTTSVSARAKQMAQQRQAATPTRPAAGSRDDDNDGGDDSGMPEATSAALTAAHRSIEAAHAAVRALQEQVDISDSEDYGDDGLGSADGTDANAVAGDADGANSARRPVTTRKNQKPMLPNATGHAIRAARRSLDSARHAMRCAMRDLDSGFDGGDGSGEGEADAGANAAVLADLDRRARELELDELEQA
jgi:Escherichia/Staphylococcus phage prohead protease